MGTRPTTGFFSRETEASGLDLAAQRLEAACGAIRAELGRARGHPRWSGLRGRSSAGRPDDEPAIAGLARDLDDAAQGEAGATGLVPAFLLRQAEIAMSLVSGLLAAVSGIERRLRAVERQLAATEEWIAGGPAAGDPTAGGE